jgi:hypothetical protein
MIFPLPGKAPAPIPGAALCETAPSVFPSPAILSSGLIAHWKGDGNALDSSGNNLNGTFYSGATTTIGLFDRALSFIRANNTYVSDTISTGRVEKGVKSKQQFINSYDNFEYFVSHQIHLKILPLNNKPKTTEDIKHYCTECGTKIKSNYKFCPSCGNEL